MKPYYEDDAVTIYHGDALDVLPHVSGVDVVVTDPPYGVAYTSRRGESVAGDEDFAVASAVLRMALPGASACAVFANHASLARTLDVVGERFERVRVGTWRKSNVNGAAGMGNPWLADVEQWVCGVDVWPARPWSGVVSAPRSTGNPAWQEHKQDAYLHPTQKPVGVMHHILGALGGGTVLDPLMGSGSTLRAAKLLGRQAIGIEVEERYCEVAAKRLAQEVLDFGGVA